MQVKRFHDWFWILEVYTGIQGFAADTGHCLETGLNTNILFYAAASLYFFPLISSIELER